jgi:hypothetical protein
VIPRTNTSTSLQRHLLRVRPIQCLGNKFHNTENLCELLLAVITETHLEDHSLSAVRHCFFFRFILNHPQYLEAVSSFLKPRTSHSVRTTFRYFKYYTEHGLKIQFVWFSFIFVRKARCCQYYVCHLLLVYCPRAWAIRHLSRESRNVSRIAL